jgi:hypothetical protein
MVETDSDAGTKSYLEKFTNFVKDAYGLNSYNIGRQIGNDSAKKAYELCSESKDYKEFGEMLKVARSLEFLSFSSANKLTWKVKQVPFFSSLFTTFALEGIAGYFLDLPPQVEGKLLLPALFLGMVLGAGVAVYSSRKGMKGFDEGFNQEYDLLEGKAAP